MSATALFASSRKWNTIFTMNKISGISICYSQIRESTHERAATGKRAAARPVSRRVCAFPPRKEKFFFVSFCKPAPRETDLGLFSRRSSETRFNRETSNDGTPSGSPGVRYSTFVRVFLRASLLYMLKLDWKFLLVGDGDKDCRLGEIRLPLDSPFKFPGVKFQEIE